MTAWDAGERGQELHGPSNPHAQSAVRQGCFGGLSCFAFKVQTDAFLHTWGIPPQYEPLPCMGEAPFHCPTDWLWMMEGVCH